MTRGYSRTPAPLGPLTIVDDFGNETAEVRDEWSAYEYRADGTRHVYDVETRGTGKRALALGPAEANQ